MRGRGFTFIEVMAVVVLIGLLGGATAWSLAGRSDVARQEEAVVRLIDFDRAARLAARREGRGVGLLFDLDDQRIMRVNKGEDGRMNESGYPVRLPSGYRVEEVVVYRAGGRGGVQGMRSGDVEIGLTSDGIGPSYAVHIAAVDREGGESGRDNRKTWVVFTGLTGQAVVEHERQSVDRLFAMLGSGRADAD